MPDTTTPPTQAEREVAVRRQRFVEAGGTLPATAADKLLLEAILASGEFLPELLFADPGALPRAGRRSVAAAGEAARGRSRGEVRAATAGAADLAEVQRGLRRVRRYEMLRLGVREIGWGTTDEVARELSAFADACLDAAVAVCDAELRREIGEPRADDGAPVRFVVMGMGKLGGDELNFSSDVDVCYFYSTDAGAARRAARLHEYYAELSRRVSAALEQATADGTVFRVDLRLRPEGRNGPMCNSLAAAEEYYETFGRTWERQAWLRARPVAGDRALGEELLAMLEPFIYPRSIDPRMVDDVRALRAMFRDPADAAGELGETGFDVKLGAGGIRDVEMVVQALQLLHAGKRRDLRERNTPQGVPAPGGGRAAQRSRGVDAAVGVPLLAAAGAPGDGGDRGAAPPHTGRRRGAGALRGRPGLPQPGGVRRRGGGASVRRSRRSPRRWAIRRPSGRWRRRACSIRCATAPMLERLASAAGFRDAEAAADTLEALGARLSPALLEQAIASPEPDRALLHFRELVTRGSGGLLALLRDEPQLGRMLGTLFGTSDRLAELLLGNPTMWDAFVGGLGADVRTRDEMRRRLAEYQHPGAESAGDQHVDDYEEGALRAVRRFQAEELLRIGLHDVAGSLDAPAVADELTDLAEVCLDAGIAATLPALTARLGAPRTGLTVLGLGSLGAREMRYGSDLDLVFLYGEDGESTTGVDHREWFARASQRFIFAMETMLEEGRLYKVDARLRPSGEQGLLVTSWASFERYHRDEAADWERVAHDAGAHRVQQRGAGRARAAGRDAAADRASTARSSARASSRICGACAAA